MAVGMLIAACAADSPRSLEQQQSDMNAMKELYSRLRSDRDYYYPNVTIRVENGVAHLSGYVWNAQALYRAQDVASKVPGVTSVVDNLELETHL
jgi:osmotically-inducible protein OsmY